MRAAALALCVAFGGSGALVLRATEAVTPGQLKAAAAVERARLEKLDPKHKPKVETKGRNELVVLSAVPAGTEPALTAEGAFRIYDLEGMLQPPSIDARGFPKPSARRLAAGPGTTILICGPPSLVCPGLNQFPPKRDVYYRLANRPALTGNDLVRKGARAGFDRQTGEPIVVLQLTALARGRFKAVTKVQAKRGLTRGAPQHLALVLDGRLLSSPSIDYNRFPDGIDAPEGLIQVTELPSTEATRALAAIIAGGPLPAPFKLVG